jgi:hypothetical protein
MYVLYVSFTQVFSSLRPLYVFSGLRPHAAEAVARRLLRRFLVAEGHFTFLVAEGRFTFLVAEGRFT